MLTLILLATLAADPGPPVAWSADVPRPAVPARSASLRRYQPDPVAAAAITAWPGSAAPVQMQPQPYVQHYWAPVVHVPRRPVYVGGFAPTYGYTYAAGSCASGACARR